MSGFGRKGLVAGTAVQPNVRPAVRQTAHGQGAGGTIHFDVTPHPWKSLFAGLACLAAVAFLVALMIEGRGLIIFRIPLDVTGARVVYGALALSALVGFGFAGLGVVHGLTKKAWLTLDHQAVEGPTRYNGIKTVRIPYNSIKDVGFTAYNENAQFISIKDHMGNKINVGRENFREGSKWPAFLQELDRRLD
ncbi:hypothetical protein INR77_10915 [Erythrobacter sp. SCSIO 43205]|uniref:hypothetical protein n=1 Tax=Erythrobacter sp. SCSIO 43205 TaxID=2779361 RepID=UPI001CA7DD3B|nr:hypothetical protein [Erythrobacter sp. SCSIO 43205]UAB77318.1 hypothetical protein INR77_10915 [Erythrobacter sp. SCSIO 43205]